MAEHWDVFLSYARTDHQLDRGILNSRNGIPAVTPTALSRPWVQEEYATMMIRAVDGKQRLIPVLLADAEMPPLLASRVSVDLRRADGPEYEREISKISLLNGQKIGPPPRTGELLPRPDSAVRRAVEQARGLRSRRRSPQWAGPSFLRPL
jgi:hypothetical protein